MDQFSDSLKLKYRKCKFKVKQWERDFRSKHGSDPTKDDIKEASTQIREAYKWYWRLKIHSLGQDSLKDATFDDICCSIQPFDQENSISFMDDEDRNHTTDNGKSLESLLPLKDDDVRWDLHTENVSSAFSCQTISKDDSTFSIDENSSHTNETDSSKELNSRRILSGIQIDTLDTKCSSKIPEPCGDGPLQGTVSTEEDSFDHKIMSEEPPLNERSNKVWGHHLNNSQNQDKKSERSNLHRSSSFQLAEKLFQGARFRKRNPRKSLSFSNAKSKSMSNISSNDNFGEHSDSSYMLDDSHDDGFPVNTIEAADGEPKQLGSSFFLIKKPVIPSVQPIGAVQKLMEHSSSNLKSKPERKIDPGWIDRVCAANESSFSEADFKNGTISLRDSFSSGANDILKASNDEDIIYDSDTDCKETDQKSRLALLPNMKSEGANKPFNSLDGESLEDERHDKHLKKRKLHALDTALVVLSQRESAEETKCHSMKRRKKSLSSDLKNNSEESGGEIDYATAEKNIGEPQPKKQKVTKLEALKKRVASGTANDNFIRINIQKKVFVRGKKTMNFQKYKKQQWKKRKRELASEASAAYASRMDPCDAAAGGGLLKCFKCGDVGHFAKACLKLKGDSLLPNDEIDEDDSPFPSLAEVEKMAQEKIGMKNFKANHGLSATNLNKSLRNCVDVESIKPVDDESNSAQGVDQHDASGLHSFQEPKYASNICFGSVQPLYPLNQDNSLIKTPSEVYDCLHKFGFQNFLQGQEEAVMRILSGLSTLVTLSTGSGKSLCYQLPAYMYACHKKSITLVISPLVSLMDDQVTGLPSFIKAAALHTGQTEKQKEKVMEMVKSGSLHFLLVSPEAVVAGGRRTGFGGILRELPDIAFACIDEVHCVSQWSHNFRPSYLMICKVLREKLGVKTILGLTATATQSTVKSIVELLHIPDGLKGVIQDVPLPVNLFLTVSRDSNRDQALLDLLSSDRFQSFGSIIIYCTRREECDRLATLLRTCLKDPKFNLNSKQKVSSTAEAYHAGLSSSQRRQVQNAFMGGKLRIVVATVAFGMGINKSNIRAVIHFNMPKSFENYVQEVGRAGRDGDISHCHLFLDDKGSDLCELRRHIFADSVDRHTIRKLLQRVFIPCKCTNNISGCLEEEKDRSDSFLTTSSLSEEQGGVTSASEKSALVSSCKGHEVAFSIESTVQALDLPEENILTLLCYLELHDQHFIKVLPNSYTLCKVRSYRGMKHIQHVAKSCPPLAMAVAIDLMKNSRLNKTNELEFPVVEIANTINWDSGTVKHELCNLEWTRVGDHSRRSGLKVELLDLGFHIKSPGNLSSEQMDAALDFLHCRIDEQEKSSLYQLELISSALNSVSFPDVKSIMNSSDSEKRSEDLKQIIRSYFLEDHTPSEKIGTCGGLQNGELIANDIRQLINLYRDCSFTGRAVARIFHGISSPNFPAQVWGRCRFWRSHLDSDFNLICQLATSVLLEMR